MIECTVLGPLSAKDGETPIAIGPPRHQKILAMLLLNAGQVVTVARLISALWPDRPPGTARDQVHNGVSALRRKLIQAGARGEVITTSFAGVMLSKAAVDVDLHRVNALLSAAREASDRHAASAALRRAVNQWTGPSLAGLTGSFFESMASALEERRLTALEECIEHELEIVPAQRLVAELTDVVAEYPVRESFTRQLMLALYRSGRPADASAVYRRLRRRLHDELGVEPNPSLVELETAILRLQIPMGAGPAPAVSAFGGGGAESFDLVVRV
jgi:DNA-binding SARP family transcriptional activator